MLGHKTGELGLVPLGHDIEVATRWPEIPAKIGEEASGVLAPFVQDLRPNSPFRKRFFSDHRPSEMQQKQRQVLGGAQKGVVEVLDFDWVPKHFECFELKDDRTRSVFAVDVIIAKVKADPKPNPRRFERFFRALRECSRPKMRRSRWDWTEPVFVLAFETGVIDASFLQGAGLWGLELRSVGKEAVEEEFH